MATSAARLYWQQAVTGTNLYAAADVSLPAAVMAFPQEHVQAPRTWTEIVAVRDSKNFEGPRLVCTREAWSEFVLSIKRGEFAL
jgi:hypothetical protein